MRPFLLVEDSTGTIAFVAFGSGSTENSVQRMAIDNLTIGSTAEVNAPSVFALFSLAIVLLLARRTGK